MEDTSTLIDSFDKAIRELETLRVSSLLLGVQAEVVTDGDPTFKLPKVQAVMYVKVKRGEQCANPVLDDMAKRRVVDSLLDPLRMMLMAEGTARFNESVRDLGSLVRDFMNKCASRLPLGHPTRPSESPVPATNPKGSVTLAQPVPMPAHGVDNGHPPTNACVTEIAYQAGDRETEASEVGVHETEGASEAAAQASDAEARLEARHILEWWDAFLAANADDDEEVFEEDEEFDFEAHAVVMSMGTDANRFRTHAMAVAANGGVYSPSSSPISMGLLTQAEPLDGEEAMNVRFNVASTPPAVLGPMQLLLAAPAHSFGLPVQHERLTHALHGGLFGRQPDFVDHLEEKVAHVDPDQDDIDLDYGGYSPREDREDEVGNTAAGTSIVNEYTPERTSATTDVTRSDATAVSASVVLSRSHFASKFPATGIDHQHPRIAPVYDQPIIASMKTSRPIRRPGTRQTKQETTITGRRLLSCKQGTAQWTLTPLSPPSVTCLCLTPSAFTRSIPVFSRRRLFEQRLQQRRWRPTCPSINIESISSYRVNSQRHS